MITEKRGYLLVFIFLIATALFSIQTGAVSYTQVWNATLENSTGSFWYGVTIDSDNNIVVVGRSSGSRAGIAKYNSTGAMLWGVNITNADLKDVVTDLDKNIYAVGLNNSVDPFVIKYDTNGNHIWNISHPGGLFGKLNAVTINLNQNLLISGYDGVTFYYPILAAYDLNANQLWNLSLPVSSYTDYGMDVEIDSQNNIYWPVHSLNSTNDIKAYLFKLNSTGGQLWNFSYADVSVDSPVGVAIDSSDNSHLVIEHYDSDSNITTILIKFNSTGSQIWNATYKAPRDADPFGIVLDSNENILIAIEYRDETDIRYLKYVKYDPDGQLIYNSTGFSRGVRDGAYAITVDSDDKIYLAGRSGYNATHYNRVLIQYDDDIPSWKNFYKIDSTTYLYNQSDLGAIPGLTLGSDTSSVTWNQNVSVKDADIDTYASMGSGYVSFNMPYLNNTFNASANVSIDVSTCDNWIIYYVDHYVTSLNELKNEGYIVGNNMIGCSTYCSNPVCSNNKLNYTVTHFDGTGGEGDASPTAVPEFSTITLILTVIITITGFIAIRQKNK